MGGKQTRGRKHLHLCLAAVMLFSFGGCVTFGKTKAGINSQEEVRQHLLRGQELLAQMDFDGALNANQEVLILALREPPEDEALFNVGLIFAHPEYPRRDVAKSLYFFNKVVEDYPQSPLAPQARAWVGMLQQTQKLNQRLEQSTRQIKQFQQERARIEGEKEACRPLVSGRELFVQGRYDEALRELQRALAASSRHSLEDEALFLAGMIYAHPGNPKKDYVKSLGYFKRLLKDHPQSSWAELAKAWTQMLQDNDRLSQAVEKLHQTIEKSKQVDIEIEEKKREKGK